MRVGILIGEICYNLRSALDYLVFELAKLDSGAPQDGTQFPIEDSPKGFLHRVKTGRLRGINAAHVAAIEGRQPYNGCHWTKALRDLSNPDKHREFPNIGGDVTAHAFSPTEDRNFGDIQATIRRTTHPVLGEMDVHFTGQLLLRSAPVEWRPNQPHVRLGRPGRESLPTLSPAVHHAADWGAKR